MAERALREPGRRRETGAVLIMVLWTATILTIMVTVLAANVRLSATTAWHNRTASEDLAAVMSAMHKAEMELIMERMPRPPDLEPVLDDEGQARIPPYRFNGQPLTLHYPADEDMVVRIYDHAGKINLNNIDTGQLRQIIQKQLGPDTDLARLSELLAAWTDWTDGNDQMTPGGAESPYYESLDEPYRARNGDLESVEELLLIRGFDEVFGDINLEAAFTVYGSGRNRTVNLNLATREAMALLPGLDELSIERILAYREQRDMRDRGDVGRIVPLEQMNELSRWIGNNAMGGYYTVYVYPRPADAAGGDTVPDAEDPGAEAPPRVRQAYRQILEIRSPIERARVLQVHPYGQLPDTSPPAVELDLSAVGGPF